MDVKFRENIVVKNKIGFVVVVAAVLLLVVVSFCMGVDKHRFICILPTSTKGFSWKIIENGGGGHVSFLRKMNTAGHMGSDCTLCLAHLNERPVRFEN